MAIVVEIGIAWKFILFLNSNFVSYFFSRGRLQSKICYSRWQQSQASDLGNKIFSNHSKSTLTKLFPKVFTTFICVHEWRYGGRNWRYVGRNSTTADEVSRFQHLFPNLQLVGPRNGVRYQKLAPISMDGQLLDGDWSTSGRVNSCKFSTKVGCLPWSKHTIPSLA